MNEIEQNLLGVLARNPDLVVKAQHRLRTEMFSEIQNRDLYNAIIESGAVDLMAIKDKLNGSVSVQYLVGCCEAGALVSNLDYYIRRLEESWIDRLMEEHALKVTAIRASGMSQAEKLDAIESHYRQTLGRPVLNNDCFDKLTGLVEDTISGVRQSIPLPWGRLGDLTNCLLPGTVTILCGNPGASKSFMLLECLTYWLTHGISCVCYELEESTEYYLLRVTAQLAGLSGITNPKWVKANPDESRAAQSQHEDVLRAVGSVMTSQPCKRVTLTDLAQWVDRYAKEGVRVICIDPVTIASKASKQPWREDENFLESIKRSAVDYGCSIVLVTHPVKGSEAPSLDTLAGGAAYSRFSQTAIWLERHDYKESDVDAGCGRIATEHNRTIWILKARNGIGGGAKLACDFCPDSLRLFELGLIKKG